MSFSKLTDEKWAEISSLMDWQPKGLERGTKRSDFRKVWNSILYVLTSGCRWKDLPKGPHLASRASAHRWLKRWEAEGVFAKVLLGLIEKASNGGKVDWERLVVDGTFSLRTRRREGSGLRLEREGSHHTCVD